jgi:serine/threonine protein kinase
MSADRNLLFGVLALQMDFIDRDQLVRAMNAWVLEKHRPLAEILLEQRALSPDCNALLQAMVQKHLQLHGDDPAKSLAAVQRRAPLPQELAKIADPDVQATLVYALSSRTLEPDPYATNAPSANGPTSSGTRFTILRPHAWGGLGRVSIALDSELRRQVALKEIQERYADDSASRARFLLEAEVTGQLEHPGVVPVYGLGSHPDGRPFYAMRFIQGESLQEALEAFHRAERHDRDPGERTLALRALLGRFVAVCNAVAYAHSRGVIHRDIKPANVMLGPFGETLLVDWGLAKLAGRTEPTPGPGEVLALLPAGGSSPTAAGQALGTPAYMPPEQAAGKLHELGPASDVYSLGATLYTVLTGGPPFRGDAAEVLCGVVEGAFPLPRRVKGDVPPALEAVCLKAMARSAADRYSSARALADEVEHWLADEPVAAYREPLAGRTSRWLRQHRAPAAAGTALLVATLLGLTAGVVLLGRANARTEEQRDLAEQNATEARQQEAKAKEAAAKAKEAAGEAKAVNAFLTEDLLAEAAPERNQHTKQVTVLELLDRAGDKVGRSFLNQPLVEASVRHILADTYLKLGQDTKGELHARRALELYRGVLGPEHTDTLMAVGWLTDSLRGQGKRAEAELLIRQNLDAMRRVLGPDHPFTLTAVSGLASVLREEGKLAEAEPLFRQNLDAMRRVLGPDHPNSLEEVSYLALLLHTQGKLTEAEPLSRQNLEAMRRVLGPDHPSTLAAVNNLAGLLKDQAKLEEAVLLLRQSLEANRRVQGPEHPATLKSANNLAGLLLDQGKQAEAEQLFRLNLDACRRLRGPDHPDSLRAVNNLARLLHDQGKQAEAEALAREALAHARRAGPLIQPELLRILGVLGSVLTARGKASEAEPLLRECLEGQRKMLPNGHWRIAQAQSLLGACLAVQREYPESEGLLLASFRELQRAQGTPGPELTKARQRLVQLYEAWGKPAEAAKWKAEHDQQAKPAAPKAQ